MHELVPHCSLHIPLSCSSILDAVRRNNFRILKLLLKLNSGIKQRDLDLALLHAVKAGFQECAEVLLLAGANPSATDSHDNMPLTHACESGNFRMLHILLDAGANIGLRDGSRGTCLHHAAKWGYEDCVALLLQKGADPNIQDGLWHTPLMLAAKHAQQPGPIIRMLVASGSDVNILGSEQRTVLHIAATRGLDIECMLAAKGDAHLQDTEGNAPLHYASMEGHLVIVRQLLAVFCDPNMANYQRRTPVHFAAMKGKDGCLRELISAMGNPFLKDSADNLPIWYSAMNGNFQTTRRLVQLNSPLGILQPVLGAHDPSSSALLAGVLEKENLAVAKLLVMGGCGTRPLADWMVQMRPTLWTDANIAHLIWLKEYLQNPIPLCNVCRLVIRRMMGTRFGETAIFLPLPKSLKQFLALKELDDWSEDGQNVDDQVLKLNLL